MSATVAEAVKTIAKLGKITIDCALEPIEHFISIIRGPFLSEFFSSGERKRH